MLLVSKNTECLPSTSRQGFSIPELSQFMSEDFCVFISNIDTYMLNEESVVDVTKQVYEWLDAVKEAKEDVASLNSPGFINSTIRKTALITAGISLASAVYTFLKALGSIGVKLAVALFAGLSYLAAVLYNNVKKSRRVSKLNSLKDRSQEWMAKIRMLKQQASSREELDKLDQLEDKIMMLEVVS